MAKNRIKHPSALAHGEINKVFENIWFVQGAVKMPMPIPMKISRSMTVIKNPASNELTLVNSMRLSNEGLNELNQLGKVAHVIRLAGFHGKDDGFYKEKYNAKIHAIKGQSYSRKFDKEMIRPEDGYLQPDEWLTEDSPLPIENAELKVFHSSKPSEALLGLKRDGGILITGDSLQNTPTADKYVNFPARLMMKKMGFFKEYNVGPGWLQFASPHADEVRSILDLEFEHVLPAHGEAVIGGAKEKFRPVLMGDLKGCHPK